MCDNCNSDNEKCKCYCAKETSRVLEWLDGYYCKECKHIKPFDLTDEQIIEALKTGKL